MSEHSVDHAKENLADLIDRALAGEGVVITRHGRPLVSLQPVRHPGRPITAEDLDWLAERRIRARTSPAEDAGQRVSRLRDEEW